MGRVKLYVLFGLIILVGLLAFTACTGGGSTYTGEKKDGKPHGQGTLTFAGGEKYVGELKMASITARVP